MIAILSPIFTHSFFNQFKGRDCLKTTLRMRVTVEEVTNKPNHFIPHNVYFFIHGTPIMTLQGLLSAKAIVVRRIS